MEFVTNGYEIEKYSLDFVKRLSVKNNRIYQEPVRKLAMLQADVAYIANEIYPTTRTEFLVRRILFGFSTAVLHALDKRMGDVYEVMMVNPSEAFNRKNGKPIPEAEATRILDNMAETLGCMIDNQDALLKGVRESDKRRAAKLPDDEAVFTEALTEAVKALSQSVVSIFIQ
jgi:hypothetical protein